jgi:hypothetical protein
MKNTQDNNGKIKFTKIESEKKFFNPFTNKVCSIAIVAEKEGKFGYLPGEEKPYMPIGGVNALKEVIDILEFR